MRLIQIPEAIYWALTMLLGAADKARSFSCFFLVFSFRFFRGKPTGRRGRGQFRRENGADDALKRRFLKKKISYVKTAQGATTNAGRLLCSTRMTKEACVFFSYFFCEKKTQGATTNAGRLLFMTQLFFALILLSIYTGVSLPLSPSLSLSLSLSLSSLHPRVAFYLYSSCFVLSVSRSLSLSFSSLCRNRKLSDEQTRTHTLPQQTLTHTLPPPLF